VSQKNRARILWRITFINIDQYQCHLIELFLQHFLIIYHKKIIHTTEYQLQLLPWQPSHSCRPTSVLLQCVCPTCTCHRRVFAPGHTWFHFSRHLASCSPDLNPVDYRIWVCLQDPYVCQKRTRDVNELKQHLVDVWSDCGQTVIDGAIDEWRKRLQACVHMKKHHFEHVL